MGKKEGGTESPSTGEIYLRASGLGFSGFAGSACALFVAESVL